jgi:hypothetical protein
MSNIPHPNEWLWSPFMRRPISTRPLLAMRRVLLFNKETPETCYSVSALVGRAGRLGTRTAAPPNVIGRVVLANVLARTHQHDLVRGFLLRVARIAHADEDGLGGVGCWHAALTGAARFAVRLHNSLIGPTWKGLRSNSCEVRGSMGTYPPSAELSRSRCIRNHRCSRLRALCLCRCLCRCPFPLEQRRSSSSRRMKMTTGRALGIHR